LNELASEYSYLINNSDSLKLQSFSVDASAQSKELSYPLTIDQLLEEGWIAFFDTDSNESYWMQLVSGRCERYLPVGDDLDNVINLGLEISDTDPQWVRPNQYPCSTSWVCISITQTQYEGHYSDAFFSDTNQGSLNYTYDPNGNNNGYAWDDYHQEWIYEGNIQGDIQLSTSQNNWYFYNTYTGQSSWSEPIGWENLVRDEWNGWWLCREEDTFVEYWYTCIARCFIFLL
jgi:hypothetical protein